MVLPFFLLLEITVLVLSIILSIITSEDSLPNILSVFVNFTAFLIFKDIQFSICLQSEITDVHSRKACSMVSIDVLHIWHKFVSDNFMI